MVKQVVKDIGNVDFELTYVCNLDCLHCYNPIHSKTTEFSTQQVMDITSDINSEGFHEIHYNGGEPLIRGDIYDILQFSTNLGLRTLLETNATLLKNQHVRGLNGLIIRASIDGSEEIHNSIRRGHLDNSYRTSLENLARAREEAPVQLTCSVNALNYGFIYKMVEEVMQYGLDDIRLRLTMPAGSTIKNWRQLRMNRQQLEVVRETAKAVQQNFPDVTFDFTSLKRLVPRFEPKFFIDPRGFVKPYPFIESFAGDLNHESVGNVLERIPRFALPELEVRRMVEYLSQIGMIK